MAEKRGGQVRAEVEMEAFRNSLTDSGLRDMGFEGYPFTWENRRMEGGYIEERLDRFVGSDSWLDNFPNACVRHLDKTRSDHRPIICDSRGEEGEEPKWGWHFRSDPFWAWNEPGAADIMSKINGCRGKLDIWSSATFPNFGRQKAKIKRALRALEKVCRTPRVEEQI
ncbi:unnamed protein product [Linum trigynum]|uniref:Uncharacterized protein n=1 Tax=Linum trigynum TaxID=586398 RepID=A0AAV2D7D3_9ROSI